ncbi:heptyl-3-hydroxy-4(1H)-quinolone synthase [Seminavis robusta]|uniref:Heptyl-3-hydroxy-4(1H)-quinolone synthase n=1 Tax=Seminavis robusta TaxID=568900 RepID=A0A9N8EZA5_9STRA|nr:heptyl-3-hydroxy-4(1H)-quinolone synthase [Seminavis robusta]|eukprot:Sro2702_g335100.1 heptyl-3-hydroxy-4(1H)-quinolone synthase (452) ;mRNA; f:2798-4153
MSTANATNPNPSILIVGGGPAGLALAAHLLTKGWSSVKVLERRDRASLLADTNSFYDMASSGIQALLRVADGAAAPGIFDQAVAFRKTAFYTKGGSGQPEFTTEWKDRSLGMPMFNVSRAVMLKALCEAVEALDVNCIQYNTNVISVDHTTGEVQVEGSDQPLKANLIVAADGIHSKIRKQIFGDSGLRSDGIIACYATLPPLTEEEQKTFPNPSGVGSAYCTMGLRADLIESTAVNKEATIWYANFLVDGKPHTVVPPKPDRKDGWLGEVRHRCEDGIPVLKALLDRTNEDQIQVVMCNDRPPLSTYHLGKVVLVGDSAHPFTPFAGLGSSQAIVDAFVLGEALLGCATTEQAVDKFEKQRLMAANALMEESRAICSTDLSSRVFFWVLERMVFPVAKRLGKIDELLNYVINDSATLVNNLVPFKIKEEEAAYQSRYDKAKSSLEAQLGM